MKPSRFLSPLARARRVWRDALALLLAARDPRTPARARWTALAAVIYAVSPVDLLPDSIPVLGVGDDLLIVPALLALAARTLPPDALSSARQRAERVQRQLPWLLPLVVVGALTLPLLGGALLWWLAATR